MENSLLEDLEIELWMVLEEQKIENDKLKYFYKNVPEFIKSLPLSNISQDIIRDIVWELNSKFGNSECKWKEFIQVMGISDRRTINEFAGTAYALHELPLYIAITSMEGQNGTFVNLIDALLEKKFLDVLLKMKPYVERLVKEGSNTIHPCRVEISSKPSMNIAKKGTPLHQDENLHSISIILLNLERDHSVACEVSNILRTKYRMKVTTLSDLKDLSVDCFGMLNAVLKKADFTVPIISKSFIKAIHPQLDFNQQSFDESKIRYVFKWEQELYLNNSLLNFRVKPLMAPDFLKHTLPNDPLLASAKILWKEFPDFVRLLNNSKKRFQEMSKPA